MAKKATAKKAPAKKAAAKKKGARQRKPESYLTERSGTAISLVDYTRKPAVSFLVQVVEAYNTFDYCKRKFKNSNNALSDEALDNLQQVAGPLFAATMGHFETFQKSFFSRLFEVTRLLKDWKAEEGIKKIESDLDLSALRMAAYRGQGAQIGLLLADSLKGWHSPIRVNSHFKCLDDQVQLFSSNQIKDLAVLWQIRHTLVHTGGWLTLPDAQKVSRLSGLGDSALAFNEHFMLAFTRLMHRMIKNAVERMETKFRGRLRGDLDEDEKNELKDLFEVSSRVASYFN